MARSARSLLKNVGDLLHVARSDAGKLSASYAELDLADICRSTGAPFAGFARDRRVTYTIVADRPIPCETDAAKIQRVLTNLLSNAFRFTPKEGTVRVSALAIEGPGRARSPSRSPTAGPACRPRSGKPSSGASTTAREGPRSASAGAGSASPS